MADPSLVSVLAFTSAPARDQDRGLLGWVAIEFRELLILDAVAVRRTRSGRLALSFPAPKDARGRRRALVRPLDDVARRAIEGAVLGALEMREGKA